MIQNLVKIAWFNWKIIISKLVLMWYEDFITTGNREYENVFWFAMTSNKRYTIS